MVYYHTSGNVKMLRNIIMDYGAASEVSPYEYMKTYIEKCPDTIEDSKLSWIAESFLGIQKHGQFLKEIAAHLSDELSEEDQDYFMIILHAVIFQITPKDMQFYYKCLFNLSKTLLNTFTKFLSNNEVLTFISQIAHAYYDTNFITEKMIDPLFTWQPYISEMAHSYAEYVKKMESRKLKPPTIPVQLNVLNRRGKEAPSSPPHTSLPVTPPNSLRIRKRMLTKSVIDQRLKQIHEKNKQKASHLLNDVKNRSFHHAQVKSERYFKRLSSIRDDMENEGKPFIKPKPTFAMKSSLPPIKDTAANLKRINKRIQIVQEEEVQWLQTLVTTFRNTAKIDEIEEFDRQEKERERLLDIERKHLMGQISYEEAVIAKKKLFDENKKRYEDFLKEKETWNQEIERWRKMEMEKNRKQVERLSLIELNLLQAKHGVVTKKKETAEKIKKESETLLAKAMKEKQEELDRRINMIKEIKILALIAKKARIPKIIDLTETSGIGSLCEMSFAELQERLTALKIGLNEELERKRQIIKEENLTAKEELQQTKTTIKNYMTERAILKKQNKKSKMTLESTPPKEISDLKKVLEEKRKLRIQLTS